MKRMRVGKMIHPYRSFLHRKVATLAAQYEPASIIDMGGAGDMKTFACCPVKDANIKKGYDGSDLYQFEDNSFDVATSVAVLEHVQLDRREAFVNESMRVSRKAAIHWFPAGEAAREAEAFRDTFGPGCAHTSCVVGPWRDEYIPCITIRESFLLLATLYPAMNTMKLHDYVCEHGEKPYGALLHLRHDTCT